jgi:DNA topoisomerase IA
VAAVALDFVSLTLPPLLLVRSTRLLTRNLLEGAKYTFKESVGDIRLISFGPCQSPTLYFTVLRADEIAAFVPRRFWEVKARAAGLELKWSKGRTFDKATADKALAACKSAKGGQLNGVEEREKRLDAPLGLNTVALLTMASNALGFSPHKTMQVVAQPPLVQARFPSCML